MLVNMDNKQHYNARIIAVRSYEDVQRELESLGMDHESAKEHCYDGLFHHLKLERVERNTATLLREIVTTLGGKIFSILNCKETQPENKVGVLIIGTGSFFRSLMASLPSSPTPLRALSRELAPALSYILEECRLTLEVKERKIDFSSKTYIMGILNVTLDSFTDGGEFFDQEKAIAHALEMVKEGADIIDLGGESTRPGAKPVETEEELRRVIPVIKAIAKETEVMLSIDTTKAKVAEEALLAGADIINDVSALQFDPEMALLVAKAGVPVVLMHMRGTPKTMQSNIHYDDLIAEIVIFLRERISIAEEAGIEREKIIIDPGIGFGKSKERDNFTILRNLEEFKSLGRPILVGPSRKAFLGHLLQLAVKEREEATAAAVAVAIMNGANILRVHDVKKMKRVAQVVDTIKKSAPLYVN